MPNLNFSMIRLRTALLYFRPKQSTVTALIQMYDEWLENLDNGKSNDVIFLDIKKAFDSINHDILLNKMKNF